LYRNLPPLGEKEKNALLGGYANHKMYNKSGVSMVKQGIWK